MERRRKLDINPVFNHRKSIALVDTAEDLVDSLDNLSVCLKHIEEKYSKVSVLLIILLFVCFTLFTFVLSICHHIAK